jgi:hypothetical protein
MNRFILFFYIAVSGLLVGCPKIKNSQKNATAAVNLEKALIGDWWQSHEEKNGDTIPFRAVGYPFPPARGRTGFKLEAAGKGIYHGIAPTDGVENKNCTWQLKDKQLIVSPDGGTPFRYEILKVEKDILYLKRLLPD